MYKNIFKLKNVKNKLLKEIKINIRNPYSYMKSVWLYSCQDRKISEKKLQKKTLRAANASQKFYFCF